jgi:VanZ family protein
MNMRFSVWLWAFIACALAVLVLALVPSPPPMITTGWDKLNHLLAFGVMAWLACKAFPQRLTIVLPGLLAYGALIEIMQSLTPNRSAEWLDLFADSLGILLGWMLLKGTEPFSVRHVPRVNDVQTSGFKWAGVGKGDGTL